MTFSFLAKKVSGILVYSGSRSSWLGGVGAPAADYMAVELRSGELIFHLSLGADTTQLKLMGDQSSAVKENRMHTLQVQWNQSFVQMRLDQCPMRHPSCLASSALSGQHWRLNAYGPLQVGGIDADLWHVNQVFRWTVLPEDVKFHGFIHNLTFNGETYNLIAPAHLATVVNCHVADVMNRADFGGRILVGCAISVVLLLVFLALIISHLRTSPPKTRKETHYHIVRWTSKSSDTTSDSDVTDTSCQLLKGQDNTLT